jgi:hypothetical protein
MNHINITLPKGCACEGVAIGSYQNQVELETPQFMRDIGQIGCLTIRGTACIDRCLETLIKSLWEKRVITTGCCCGHNQVDGFVGIIQP